MSEDNDFKQMVGKALVSFDQKLSELNQTVSGMNENIASINENISGMKADISGIDRKLDGIGTYLLSSDRTHQENDRRITALEGRVDKLEKKDTA